MALGGGVFTAQNKKLPGSYINFVSVARATAALSDRGIAAMGFTLDWGADNEIITVTRGDFEKYSSRIFGYDYGHEKLRGLRDLFRNIHTLYAYKLNSSTDGIAKNDLATALHSGARGNDITIVIVQNADDETKWDVKTVFDGLTVDVQTVKEPAELVPNDYVKFTVSELTANPGEKLTGGTSAKVTVANHQTFLDKIESYTFNTIGVVSDEREGKEGEQAKVNGLYASFCKRMRDEMGVKFQAVMFRNPADYEGVVNVENTVQNSGWSEASLVYWVTGVVAGTAVNASALNQVYDGEFAVNVDYTQAELEACIDNGKFTLHRVNQDVRVLCDVNSLVNTTAEKGDIFKENQTIRVIDCIGNDIAALFNTKYLGKIPNDQAGRISLWADIVAHHKQLQDIRAIENFDENAVVVEQGQTKKAVAVQDAVTIVNAMAQLYMTCVIA